MEIRIGVVGTGAIGRDHINRINTRVDGARVVAINDINEEACKVLAEQIGATYFSTGEELIASPEVDAVLVTSWDPTHATYVMEALKHDKYVFCEKPLAVEIEDCLNIVNLEVEKKKRLVQVGFMRRYDRGYQNLKEELNKGYLGEPLILHCTHRNEEVDESYDTPMAVVNTAVHEIDVLRWLLDDDFVSTEVILPRKQTSFTHKNLRDPQIIILETASGIHIDLEVFVNCQFGYDINCNVVCEKGEIGLTNPAYYRVKTAEKDYTRIPGDWKERFINAYDNEFQIWVNDMKNDTLTGPSAWDGYMAAVTTTACSNARDTGERVKIEFTEKPTLYNKK